MPDRDRSFGVRIPLTADQRRDLSRRAGLEPFDGRALAEYVTGYLFGEPEPQLLKRVHAVRDSERAAFRLEIERSRREREQRKARAVAGSRTSK